MTRDQIQTLLSTIEHVVSATPGARVACVVMQEPKDDNTECHLVAHCSTDDLIVSVGYLLGTILKRMACDPECELRAAIETSLAALPLFDVRETAQ